MYGPSDAESIATMHAALERGVTLLDTGEFYGMGQNALLIRRALEGRRHQAQLSVKFGALRGPDGSWGGFDARPAAMKNFLAHSLTPLGTDYVDVYRPARLDPSVPIEETVGAIARMVEARRRAGHRPLRSGCGHHSPRPRDAPHRRSPDRVLARDARSRGAHLPGARGAGHRRDRLRQRARLSFARVPEARLARDATRAHLTAGARARVEGACPGWAQRLATGVAKKKKSIARTDPSEALENLERPQMRWKVIAQVVGAYAIIWLLGAMLEPYISFWGLVVAGVLTLVGIGFGIYVWRLTRKSAAIVDILKGATDAQGRADAIEKLAKRSDDALSNLARAQLVAQKDPGEAVRILESIDLAKAPAVVQDDVRSNLGLMYLVQNRTKEARALADEIRLDRQPQAKAKAMYAAVISEAFSRTGKAEEAMKLLETYDPKDPAYVEVRPVLLRAQVFTYFALKKRGLAQKAMENLAEADTNMVASLTQKGVRPEIVSLARGTLGRMGVLPRQTTRQRGR